MTMKTYGFLLLVALPVFAQQRDNQEKTMVCQDRNGNNDREHFCEIREYPLSGVNRVVVDGRQNGGVSVKGWHRREVLVRAKVEAWAASAGEAKALASQTVVQTGGGNVFADVPQSPGRNMGGAVSYEIFVPTQTALSLKAHNGGIHISDVTGQIDFQGQNGGVHLSRVGGTVKGQTTNGGLHVELAGNRWEGSELDVATTNGGVSLSVPEQYSARLETSTRNGRVKVDFPVSVTGDLSKQLSLNLGSGGPLIRVVTTNGGVHIKRPS